MRYGLKTILMLVLCAPIAPFALAAENPRTEMIAYLEEFASEERVCEIQDGGRSKVKYPKSRIEFNVAECLKDDCHIHFELGTESGTSASYFFTIEKYGRTTIEKSSDGTPYYKHSYASGHFYDAYLTPGESFGTYETNNNGPTEVRCR
jgi:hypothetical protein